MYRRFNHFECTDFISGRIEKWNGKMICCSLVLFSIHAQHTNNPKRTLWGCYFLKSKIFAKQTLLPQKQYTLLSKTSAKNSYPSAVKRKGRGLWIVLRIFVHCCLKGPQRLRHCAEFIHRNLIAMWKEIYRLPLKEDKRWMFEVN